MTGFVYRVIVWMHPPAFRQRFGDEMLSIFDESGPEYALTLVRDGLVSLLRQWLLRRGSWKVILALFGAFIQMWAFGLPASEHQHWGRNHEAMTPYMEELILMTVALMCSLFAMVMSLTLWTMRFQRRLSVPRAIRQSVRG